MAANMHSDRLVSHGGSLGQNHLYCILATIHLPLVGHYFGRRQFRSSRPFDKGWLRQAFLFRKRARAFMLSFIQHLVIWYQVWVMLARQLGWVLGVVHVDYAMILRDLLLNHWGSFGESLCWIHWLVLCFRWQKLLVGNWWWLHMLDSCQWPCLEVIKFLTLIVNRPIFLYHVLLLGGGTTFLSARVVLICFICVQDSLQFLTVWTTSFLCRWLGTATVRCHEWTWHSWKLLKLDILWLRLPQFLLRLVHVFKCSKCASTWLLDMIHIWRTRHGLVCYVVLRSVSLYLLNGLSRQKLTRLILGVNMADRSCPTPMRWSLRVNT